MASNIAEYRIEGEPYYRPTGNEVSLYGHAYAYRMPLILKGPTGCGETRFVECKAWKLGLPLVTLACNEDMTSSDLVGRFLLDAQGTAWHDGPLTVAVRHGGICYLDEVVEARQDTTVVIHAATLRRTRIRLPRGNHRAAIHVAHERLGGLEVAQQRHASSPRDPPDRALGDAERLGHACLREALPAQLGTIASALAGSMERGE